MRTLSNYVNEAIKICKSASNISVYTCQPNTKEELKDIIEERIKSEGPNCDLNDIDVSKITDMSYVFYESSFTGDISGWDVTNVIDMTSMFDDCNFNGDISRWNVSNVKDMESMFLDNKHFNCDISSWNVSNVENMSGMFAHTRFNQDISKWNVYKVRDMRWMFEQSSFNKDISNWKLNTDCFAIHMFLNCPIKEEYKPKQLQQK